MKKKFTPQDMKQLRYLSWPVISRDGSVRLYVERVGEEKSGLFLPSIRIIDDAGDRALTEEGHSEKQPLFLSEDSIAFLSDESGEYQIYTKNLTTGEKTKVTSLRHGVNRYAVNAETGTVVFEATLWPEDLENHQEFTEMSAGEKEAWKQELDNRPYYVTTLMYKMDEWYGMRKGETNHVGTVRLDGTGASILPLKFEAENPSVSPDGNTAAFYGYPHEGAMERSAELYVYDLKKKELKQVSEKSPVSSADRPVFTPDGTKLLYAGYSFKDRSAVLVPWEIDIASGEKRKIFDVDDDRFVCHGVGAMTIGRSENGENVNAMQLSEDGQTLYFISTCKGRENLYKVSMKAPERSAVPSADAGDPADGKTADAAGAEAYAQPELFVKAETDIQSFCVDGSGKAFYMMGTTSSPADPYYDGQRQARRNAWLDDYEIAPVEEHRFTSKDGKVEVPYFLVKPVGVKEGETVPAVLDIKGGPQTMYGAAFWHEFQALAAEGFAVVCANIRGSSGFERSYFAGELCWDQEAVDDLIGAVEDAANYVPIDLKRVGVTGGSYGGYMTNKLISQTKFFAAAVTQRSLVNTATSYGTGDMGFVNGGRGLKPGFTMMGYLENRARTTLIRNIDNIKIPLLILHAFKDYRCSFEQGEQLFVAMQDRNPEVPCRLVMFPEENHGLTRTGKMHSQIRHLSEMTNWFVKYLQKEDKSDEQ